MTHKIFVGYTVKQTPGIAFPEPEFIADARCTTDAGKEKNKAEQREKYLLSLASIPYTGTFDEVCILIPSVQKAATFKSEGRGAGGKKPSICVAVRNLLMKAFPDSWPNDTHPPFGKPDTVFFGFKIRLFLKMLGLECSLPANNCPLPPPVWYNNTDFREISEAVLPQPECKLLDYQSVILARRIGLPEDEIPSYDKLFADWTGPGVNPEKDAQIALLWSGQLGFNPAE